MKKLGALLIALLWAASACVTDEGPRPLPKPGYPPTSISDVPECRNIGTQLLGRVASIYRAKDTADIYVLVVDGDPTCATDVGGVNDSGVVPDTTPVDAAKCPICDGQPMPANTFPGLQR